tara:strand:- start:954 stop:1130 length:177 start_codon:yes stop_codon:yes gene_type:complete
MQRKNKCDECDRNGVVVENKKIYCAECYMFNNDILPRIVRSTKRKRQHKSINYNKTLH